MIIHILKTCWSDLTESRQRTTAPYEESLEDPFEVYAEHLRLTSRGFRYDKKGQVFVEGWRHFFRRKAKTWHRAPELMSDASYNLTQLGVLVCLVYVFVQVVSK